MKTVLIALLLAMTLLGTGLAVHESTVCSKCCTCKVCKCSPCKCCGCSNCTCEK
jgi:hypothetical protein